MSESLEDRVAKIEVDLHRIKERLSRSTDNSNWISKTAGSFRGDSIFAEIVRLGKEVRDSEKHDLDDQ